MEDDQKLTKKQRKQLAKEERQVQEVQKAYALAKQKWFIIGAVIFGIAAIVGIAFYIANKPAKPLPGTLTKDLGRDHVSDISEVKYASNPPTSGPHFPIWAKRGVYDRVLSDGYLIHDLEHGYIVISYNCEKLPKSTGLIQQAYAHEGEEAQDSPDSKKALMHMNLSKEGEMSPFTTQNPPAKEVDLPSSFSSPACKALVKDLSTFLESWQRIVIVPRLNLDVPIALTAWTRIEKFHSFDKEKMEEFITAYHNAGPEQTVE